MTRKGLISNGVIAGAMAALAVTLSGGAASAGSAEEFCQNYAQQAVKHNAQARAHNCGFSGKNWNANTKGHRQFCLKVGPSEALTYAHGRANAIKTCTAKKKKKKGPVGTSKGSTGAKKLAEKRAACQKYAREYDALYRETARVCKDKVGFQLGNTLKDCLDGHSSAAQRDKVMKNNMGYLIVFKATCKRR